MFSVHDEVLDPQDAEWEDGFAFLAANEVAALDTEQYGTNFTTEAFVRAQLARVDRRRCGRRCSAAAGAVLHTGPVGRHTRCAQPAPLVYENGPNGALDWLEVDGRDFLLTGWAGDTGFAEPGAASHRITRVEVSFTDGTTVDADLGLPRPEIAVYLGRPGDALLEASGWAVRGRARRRLRPADIVTVTAICEHGGRFVLDSTRVADMLTRTGGTLPPAPMERRLETARTVLRYRGAAGLVELVPTVARNEWRRLGRRLRAISRDVRRS